MRILTKNFKFFLLNLIQVCYIQVFSLMLIIFRGNVPYIRSDLSLLFSSKTKIIMGVSLMIKAANHVFTATVLI